MKSAHFKIRLKIRMQELEINQTELSKKTGIPRSAISHYLRGTFEPKQQRLQILADALGTDPAWLMGYDVTIEPRINLNTFEDDVISKFTMLDEEGKKQIAEWIEFKLEQNKSSHN